MFHSGPMMSAYSFSASGSVPGASAIDCSVIAASSTLLTIGPAVSWEASIGEIPYPGTSPSVGFSPTSLCWVDGLMIEPDVSVPIVSAANPAAAAAAEPEDEPLGPSAASIALST